MPDPTDTQTHHVMAHHIAEQTPAESPLESLSDTIAFSSADWGAARDLAWIYGIVLGWDDEDDPDESAMPEIAQRYGWTTAGVARLRRLHAEYERLSSLPRVISDPEELDALPVGSVVLVESFVWRSTHSPGRRRWKLLDGGLHGSSADVLRGGRCAATVLHIPTQEGQADA